MRQKSLIHNGLEETIWQGLALVCHLYSFPRGRRVLILSGGLLLLLLVFCIPKPHLQATALPVKTPQVSLTNKIFFAGLMKDPGSNQPQAVLTVRAKAGWETFFLHTGAQFFVADTPVTVKEIQPGYLVLAGADQEFKLPVQAS